MKSESNPSSWRLSLQAWFGLLALGLAFWLVVSQAPLLLEVGLVLLGALLLNLAIRPLANRLARWHIPRSVSVLGVYLGLVIILVVMGGLLVPVIAAEVDYVRANGGALLTDALDRFQAVPLSATWLPSLDSMSQNLVQKVEDLLGPAAGVVIGVGELTLDVLVALALAFFFATDAGMGQRLLGNWVPSPQRGQLKTLAAHVEQRLTRWVWAQAGIGLYFALVFSLGLSLLGIPFALTIGLIGGILEIIPYLGGFVALVLAVLSGLTVNPWSALWACVFYLVVMQVEAHVIAPLLYGRILHLHPALVLVTLFLGAKAAGVIGVLFAVPVTVVLVTLLEEVRSILGPSWMRPDD